MLPAVAMPTMVPKLTNGSNSLARSAAKPIGHGQAGEDDARPAHAVALEEPSPEPSRLPHARWNCSRQ